MIFLASAMSIASIMTITAIIRVFDTRRPIDIQLALHDVLFTLSLYLIMSAVLLIVITCSLVEQGILQ